MMEVFKMDAQDKTPNNKLKHQRGLRGWSQKKVASSIGTSKDMISRWETGERDTSIYYQEQLCSLFGLNAVELGFLEPLKQEETFAVNEFQPQEVTSMLSAAVLQSILDVIQPLGGHNRTMNHLSRRETIAALFGLVGANAVPLDWWEQLMSSHPSAMKEDEFNYFQQIIEGGWGFLNVGEWDTAERVLESLLSDTIRNAPRQRESAILAAQGLLLRSLIAAHHMKLTTMVPYCKQAVAYAKYADDHTTLCATLNGLAVAFKYNQQEEDAFKTYMEALSYCDDKASSLVRSRVYAGVAAAFARKGRNHEADLYINLAYEYFPVHPEQDPHFLSADHGSYMLAYYQGITYLALNQPQDALKTFESYHERIPTQIVPRRNQLEIINHKGKAAILSNNVEIYIQCLQEGLKGALEIKSQKRLNELLSIFHEDVPRAWSNEASIIHITKQYPLLLEAK
jgi:transcriptional regulator with XRE-family HTH domain/tetratricopeptide (TPR) repeat protein